MYERTDLSFDLGEFSGLVFFQLQDVVVWADRASCPPKEYTQGAVGLCVCSAMD